MTIDVPDDRAPSPCPNCRHLLVAHTVGEAPVEVCRTCVHLAVEQRFLSPLLEITARRIAGGTSAALTVKARAAVVTSSACPRCAREMTVDDYCSAGIVAFNRCDGCSLLWLSAQQLGLMSIMWADMNRKLEVVHALNEQLLRDATMFVDEVRAARAVADMLAGAFRV
ncbi:MAG TPA: hypothetical protein VHO67_22995 [Polyangia bacterium]|nr:hypothetical protein [Polyangia bacterium]